MQVLEKENYEILMRKNIHLSIQMALINGWDTDAGHYQQGINVWEMSHETFYTHTVELNRYHTQVEEIYYYLYCQDH